MENTNENMNKRTNETQEGDPFDFDTKQVENLHLDKDQTPRGQLLGQCHTNGFHCEIQNICSSPLITSIIADDEKDRERLPTTPVANTINNHYPLYSDTEDDDGAKGNDLVHIHDKAMTIFSNLTLIQNHTTFKWDIMQDGRFFDTQQCHRLRHQRHQHKLQSISRCSPNTDMANLYLTNNDHDAHGGVIFNEATTKATRYDSNYNVSICPSFNTIDQYYSQLFYRDMTNSFQHSSNNETKEKRFFEIPAFLARSRMWIQDKIRESKNSSASQQRHQGKNPHHWRSNNTILSRSDNHSSSVASKSKNEKEKTRNVTSSKASSDSTRTANDYNQSTKNNHKLRKRITLNESKSRIDHSGDVMESEGRIPSNNILDYYEDEPIMESVSQYLKMAISHRKRVKKRPETTKI